MRSWEYFRRQKTLARNIDPICKTNGIFFDTYVFQDPEINYMRARRESNSY